MNILKLKKYIGPVQALVAEFNDASVEDVSVLVLDKLLDYLETNPDIDEDMKAKLVSLATSLSVGIKTIDGEYTTDGYSSKGHTDDSTSDSVVRRDMRPSNQFTDQRESGVIY